MRAKYLSVVVVFVALLLLPLSVRDAYLRHLFILTFLFATVVASWDLTLGYAGIFNFGHIAFFGIGIYTLGILTTKLGVESLARVAGRGIDGRRRRAACRGAGACGCAASMSCW